MCEAFETIHWIHGKVAGHSVALALLRPINHVLLSSSECFLSLLFGRSTVAFLPSQLARLLQPEPYVYVWACCFRWAPLDDLEAHYRAKRTTQPQQYMYTIWILSVGFCVCVCVCRLGRNSLWAAPSAFFCAISVFRCSFIQRTANLINAKRAESPSATFFGCQKYNKSITIFLVGRKSSYKYHRLLEIIAGGS